MPLYLGVDVGTQSCKALVWDSKSRKVVGRGKQAYGIIPSMIVGKMEQDPKTWLEAGRVSIKEALSHVDSSEVAAMGVSGQQHGLVALDADENVIRNAKLWCDTEASVEAQQMLSHQDCVMAPGFTAPILKWLQNNEPENYERLRHVLLPHNYFNYYLTGSMSMECGDASGTGLLDISTREFDGKTIDSLDPNLHAYLPRIMGPNDVLGTLKKDVAADLGLSQSVVVSGGSGDNMMSALGAGAVDNGDLVISLGTSGTMFSPCSHPVLDVTGTIAPFCDATGKWLPLVCTMNCTGPAEEVRSAFGLSRTAIQADALMVEPGSGGVNFLPYLTGERTPSWPHATGTILGLRPGSLQPGTLYRAALEGSTFALMSGITSLEEFGIPVKGAQVVGGGANNQLWRRIISDALQIPLTFNEEPETAALGAAFQAAAVHQQVPVDEFVTSVTKEESDEIMEPDASKASLYAGAYARHLEAGKRLFGNS